MGRRIRVGIGFALLLLLMASVVASAQTGDGYDFSWSTIDGGGAKSSGGDYALVGTAGQPDADVLTGGDYALAGGFWGFWSGAATWYDLFLPLMLRDAS